MQDKPEIMPTIDKIPELLKPPLDCVEIGIVSALMYLGKLKENKGKNVLPEEVEQQLAVLEMALDGTIHTKHQLGVPLLGKLENGSYSYDVESIANDK